MYDTIALTTMIPSCCLLAIGMVFISRYPVEMRTKFWKAKHCPLEDD
jgi:hypothetical protein